MISDIIGFLEKFLVKEFEKSLVITSYDWSLHCLRYVYCIFQRLKFYGLNKLFIYLLIYIKWKYKSVTI